jgi:hypothetical protein
MMQRKRDSNLNAEREQMRNHGEGAREHNLSITSGLDTSRAHRGASDNDVYVADHAIFELTRRLAEAAGETPPRGEVISDALEAGLSALSGAGEQNANKSSRNFAILVARLEPHEFERVQELANAGRDEAAFHQAFEQLRSDASLSGESLARVVAAYTGTDRQAGDRDVVLGAIEDHFYTRQKSVHQAQQNGGRSGAG